MSRGINRSRSSIFDVLPEEIITMEILSRVASSSFTDLINLKFVCRSFRELSDQPYILERMQIDTTVLLTRRYNSKVLRFLKRCRKARNGEALFYKGLNSYFSYKGNRRSGIKNLKRAAEKLNKEAIYTYGNILLFEGGESNERNGFKLLNSLRKPSFLTTMVELQDLQKRIHSFKAGFWYFKASLLTKRKRLLLDRRCSCNGVTTKALAMKHRSQRWQDVNKHEDIDMSTLCGYCLWYDHLPVFFNEVIVGLFLS